MKSRLILLFLASLFVFAQYMSFEQAAHVMADTTIADDMDDPEDVVTVDPFLAAVVAKPPEQQAPSATPMPAAVSIAAVPGEFTYNRQLTRLEEQNYHKPPERLWLVNRALLI